ANHSRTDNRNLHVPLPFAKSRRHVTKAGGGKHGCAEIFMRGRSDEKAPLSAAGKAGLHMRVRFAHVLQPGESFVRQRCAWPWRHADHSAAVKESDSIA